MSKDLPMTRIIRIAFCLCLGVLSGCKISLPAKSQLEHLQAAANIEPSISNSLHQRTVFAAGSWPKQQWWLSYQSPELNALISESLTNNPFKKCIVVFAWPGKKQSLPDPSSFRWYFLMPRKPDNI